MGYPVEEPRREYWMMTTDQPVKEWMQNLKEWL